MVYGFEMKLKFFDMTFDFSSNGTIPIECILLKFVECTHLEGVYICDKYIVVYLEAFFEQFFKIYEGS